MFPPAALLIADSLVQSSLLDSFEEGRGMEAFCFGSVCLLAQQYVVHLPPSGASLEEG